MRSPFDLLRRGSCCRHHSGTRGYRADFRALKRMKKETLVTVIILTVLAGTVALGIYDTRKKGEAPVWLVTFCTTLVSGFVWNEIKKRRG